MAVFYLQQSALSRSRSRSAVQAAAYRSATALYDQRRDRVFDFSSKGDVTASRMIAPEGSCSAPLDRQEFWNEVERREVRRDAIVAREVLITLPSELELAAGLALAEGFARHAFVRRGLVVDLNVHGPDERGQNLHAHLLLSTRPFLGRDPDGHMEFGLKRTELEGLAYLLGLRAEWADAVNCALAQAGLDRRVDHRSFRKRGLDLRPTLFVPLRIARALRTDGYVPADPERAEVNGEQIAAHPKSALQILADEQSAFTREELARFLKRFSTPGAKRAFTLSAVMSSPEIVRLGTGPEGGWRFTSRAVLDRQAALERTAVVRGEAPGTALLILRSPRGDLPAALPAVLGGRALSLVSSAAPDDALDLGRLLEAPSAALGTIGLRVGSLRGGGPRVLLLCDADQPHAGALHHLLDLTRGPGDLLILHVAPDRAVRGQAGGAFRGLEERTGGLVFADGELSRRTPSPLLPETEVQRFARHLGLGLVLEAPGSFTAVQGSRRRDHALLCARRLPHALAAYVAVVRELTEGPVSALPRPESERSLTRAHLRLQAACPDGDRLRGLPRSLAELEALGPGTPRRVSELVAEVREPGLEL